MNQSDLSGVERAVFGLSDLESARRTLDAFARQELGAGIVAVLFRSGRIDAVWGAELSDGRRVVLKAHRQPADLRQLRLAARAQRLLVGSGFACPLPMIEPVVFRGLALTAETFTAPGAAGSVERDDDRRALVAALAGHVAILSRDDELVAGVGAGSAWCRYRDGPWPTPHDTVFDFSRTPSGYGWLDAVAREAATQLASGSADVPAIGHDDWCSGNVRFADGRLAATFDWGLVQAPEAAIVGFSAAGFTDDGSSSSHAPTPEQVRTFLAEYDAARGRPFTAAQQSTAAAAATWTMSYNARCQLSGIREHDPPAGSSLALLRDRSRDYLTLRW